jgi:asparagine synthetase B (glutamine-hydrolysing)
MFLIAITKNGVSHQYQSGKIEEFNLHANKITIITDSFLSDFFSEPDGFSIIESPLIKTSDVHNIIFSKITYNTKKDHISIFKNTTSGRPIYYFINTKGEFFCSTHISMLRKAGISIEENIEVLPEFFIYRCVVPPQTLYKDIKQVVAGSRVDIKLVNGRYEIFNIDGFNPPQPVKDHLKEDDVYAQDTLTYLDKSIKVLRPCSEKIGVILSGGLDSSILFKICQDNYGINTSYSTGYPFEDPKKNKEKDYALSAADAFRIKNLYYNCSTEQYLNGFIEGISSAEEPLHHLQSVLLYLLFKEGIPKEKNIIISGLGADGLFGTTTHYNLLYSKKITKFFKYLPPGLLKKLNRTGFKNNSMLKFVNRKIIRISDFDEILWSIGVYGYDKWVKQYFNVTQEDITKGRKNLIKPYENRSINDQISLLDFFRTSVTQTIWSKLGESQGKIIYYPYNTFELMNYAFFTPWDIKLKAPKYILRNVARRLEIPEFIITRPKSSFGINSDVWMRKGGTFESLVPLALKIINEKEIRKMQMTEMKKAMTYWNMLNYAIWKRLCINNEPLEVLKEELG